MFLTEYDAERQRELDRQEGIELGIERGIELGIERGIEQGIERGIEQSIGALRAAGLEDAADLLERQAASQAAAEGAPR